MSPFEQLSILFADPAFAERVRALLPPPKTQRWTPRPRLPTTHQGAREGDAYVPLCGTDKKPIYLTDHARPLSPNGPVTCPVCRSALGLPTLKDT